MSLAGIVYGTDERTKQRKIEAFKRYRELLHSGAQVSVKEVESLLSILGKRSEDAKRDAAIVDEARRLLWDGKGPDDLNKQIDDAYEEWEEYKAESERIIFERMAGNRDRKAEYDRLNDDRHNYAQKRAEFSNLVKKHPELLAGFNG